MSFFDERKEKIWTLMDKYLPRDENSIQESILKHIEYTLGKNRFQINNQCLYYGSSLSVRDRLLEQWNDTQLYYSINNPKTVYYMSIEFLLGRLFQNALVCLDLEQKYKDSLFNLGVKIEDLYEEEHDPALGNGGLGRLAACYIDSLTTLNYPAYGYGIRYDYGIFKQVIENFEQKEFPDYWLAKGSPWEVMRLDSKYNIRFYGYCRDVMVKGKKVRKWAGGEVLTAVAYDTIIPGYQTYNCNTLRLWKSFPSEEFDFEMFNKGEFDSSISDKNSASFITSVLYPNDNSLSGRELRLKQEYFFCSATIQDIIHKFRKYKYLWKDFPKYNCLQLNDTHPALAITELLRILMDEYLLEYKDAFNIVKRSFNYTNHTVLPEALEKWGVDIFERLLPRHLEIIYLINYFFMEDVRKKYPNDGDRMGRLSIIEEAWPKKLRMANLCIVCSTKVNGVAKIHSGLLKTALFKDFYELWPEKFTNVTNGVTPRRWVHCAFPELSSLLTKYNGGRNDWLAEYDLLEDIPKKIKEEGTEKDFMERYRKGKLAAKLRLKDWVKKHCNIDIDENFMYDIMVKRIHEYKRQQMNIFYCIHRYLAIKRMSNDQRKKLNKKVSFFGGKAAPGYALAKNIIKLINMVANVVNNDSDVSPYYKIVFLPDYKVSAAQIIIPAADISEHISTAGLEASGTSCMKFVMTGSIIIGTHDGANIEIADEVGEDHIFFFGKEVNDVTRIREELRNGKRGYVSGQLQEVFDALYNNRFGNTQFIHDYISGLTNGGDYYLTCHDFDEYVATQDKIDIEYQKKDEWDKKCIENICHMGFFSSDRSIQNYANDIWNITPCEVPQPSIDKEKHYVSTSNLALAEEEK
jgi:starch phosphorylase